MEGNKTSTGLEPNIAGLLCYVLGWVTGLVFYFMEKDNKFVRFHAMQSILVFGGITVLYIVVGIIQSIISGILAATAGYGAALAISGFFVLIFTLIGLASFVLWVLLMLKAYQNDTYKLPITGNMAEKQLQ